MKLKIRSEKKTDYAVIKIVNDLAFGRENEGRLIEKLRKTEKYNPELSLIATSFGEIIGHILFYPIEIKSHEKSMETICLAPMSVLPEFQSFGIGTILIRNGLEILKGKGYKHVHVLGHAGYYPRFGFREAKLFNIYPGFEVPSESFLMLELEEASLKDTEGTITYPDEYMDAL